MKQRPLGNSGLSGSIVGLGAWVLGGGPTWGQETDDAETVRAIQRALDVGINLIDTAPAYGWGRSERVVGQALKGRRHHAVLATKCGLWWEDERGSFFTELAGKKMYRSLRPDTLQLEIENSLRRLEVDHIDLYQTHWPSTRPEHTPIAELVIAWTAAQPGVPHVLAGGRNLAQVTENAKAGELTLMPEDLGRIRRDVVALGEPE